MLLLLIAMIYEYLCGMSTGQSELRFPAFRKPAQCDCLSAVYGICLQNSSFWYNSRQRNLDFCIALSPLSCYGNFLCDFMLFLLAAVPFV